MMDKKSDIRLYNTPNPLSILTSIPKLPLSQHVQQNK